MFDNEDDDVIFVFVAAVMFVKPIKAFVAVTLRTASS